MTMRTSEAILMEKVAIATMRTCMRDAHPVPHAAASERHEGGLHPGAHLAPWVDWGFGHITLKQSPLRYLE